MFPGRSVERSVKPDKNDARTQEEAFRYPLETGEKFQAPEVILSYSSEGMNLFVSESASLYQTTYLQRQNIKKKFVQS